LLNFVLELCYDIDYSEESSDADSNHTGRGNDNVGHNSDDDEISQSDRSFEEGEDEFENGDFS